MIEKKIKINHEKGIHARVAAALVHKANDIQEKHNVNIFIKYNEKIVPSTSLMVLINLKVRDKEEVIIEVTGEEEEIALEEIVKFFNNDFGLLDNNTINQIDSIIDENVITLDQVFQNIGNGIIATDEKDNVIIFNSFAEKIFNIKSSDIVGKNIIDVMPDSRLNIVRETGNPEIMVRKVIYDNIILINRTPMIINEEIKGAIGVFEDISKLEKVKGELREVKELKERLQRILQSVQDGICVINGSGVVEYVNDSYLNILNITRNDIIDKNIKEISPNGLRNKVLENGESIKNAIIKKSNDITIVSNINPIVIDNEIEGVISVVKNLKEVQVLTKKLNEVSARANYLEEELIRTKKPEMVFSNFIGKSGKVIDAMSVALKAAQSKATILIRGESGTGKEIIAEGIHYASTSFKGPFIRVNCAAIPENLLESELFGHEKGSFTGAIKRKLGKFELAQHGTIFLDEIGEMEKNMQSKILRVLQEKEIQRIGGEETIKLDIRVIAATNRNLEDMIKEGQFREDLYYRLNVIPIFLPPLRERKQDIGLLVEHFMNKFQSYRDKPIRGISNEAMEALLSYAWPGNVREFENLFERLFALVDEKYIELKHLPPYIRGERVEKQNYSAKDKAIKLFETDDIFTMEEYEKIIIVKALKKYGSYNAAGKVLGLNHKTIASKARKYGIEKVVAWEKGTR
ncbi:MAG: HPr family phosphocarrier protein [Clostridium sp.]|nr:HPr family phosphocarrier protein [Clostridium sp.]